MVNDGLGNFGSSSERSDLFENPYRINTFPHIEQRTVIKYLRSSIIHVSFAYPTHEQSMTPLLNRNPPEPQTGKRIQPFFFT
jgi:hypothetical protein